MKYIPVHTRQCLDEVTANPNTKPYLNAGEIKKVFASGQRNIDPGSLTLSMPPLNYKFIYYRYILPVKQVPVERDY